MPPLRPIGHEGRLSLVEHLDELRTRIVLCITPFVLAFSFTYWQNDQVLEIINKPVVKAFDSGSKENPEDKLGQTTVFNERIGALAKELEQALPAIGRSAASAADKKAIADATKAAGAVAEATPT